MNMRAMGRLDDGMLEEGERAGLMIKVVAPNLPTSTPPRSTLPSSLPRPTRLECFKVPPADGFSMDPLSITAAIAIATAAAQISKAISRLRAFGEVPTQVYAIKNEVSDLKVVLRQVGHAIEQGTLAQNTDRKSLQQTLDRAKTDLADLARALQRVADACDGSKLKAISKTLVWACHGAG